LKYARENENDLKDKMNFAENDLHHFPPGGKRLQLSDLLVLFTVFACFVNRFCKLVELRDFLVLFIIFASFISHFRFVNAVVSMIRQETNMVSAIGR